MYVSLLDGSDALLTVLFLFEADEGAARLWTEEDDKILREGKANGDSSTSIANRIQRTGRAVQSRWSTKKPAWEAAGALPFSTSSEVHHIDRASAGLLVPTSSSTVTDPPPSTLAPSSTATAIPNLLPPSFGSFRAAQLASASAAALAFTPYRDPPPSTASRPLLPPPPPTARPAALSHKSTNLLPTSTLPSPVKPASPKPPAPFRRAASSSSSSAFAPPAVQPVLSALPGPTRAPPNVSQQSVQYRLARLQPLLSRIRRVLEENEDGGDEDD